MADSDELETSTQQIGFLRHFETVYSAKGTLNGRADKYNTGLSVDVEEKVRLLAPSLIPYDFGVICYSPLERAKRTAELLGEESGIKTRELNSLIEVDMGFAEGEGNKKAKMALCLPQLGFWTLPLWGGESFNNTMLRYLSALDTVAQEYGNSNALFVTHGGFMGLANVANLIMQGKNLWLYEKINLIAFKTPDHGELQLNPMPSLEARQTLRRNLTPWLSILRSYIQHRTLHETTH